MGVFLKDSDVGGAAISRVEHEEINIVNAVQNEIIMGDEKEDGFIKKF